MQGIVLPASARQVEVVTFRKGWLIGLPAHRIAVTTWRSTVSVAIGGFKRVTNDADIDEVIIGTFCQRRTG